MLTLAPPPTRPLYPASPPRCRYSLHELDTSCECPGKASNSTHAGRVLSDLCMRHSLSPAAVNVTVMDADTLLSGEWASMLASTPVPRCRTHALASRIRWWDHNPPASPQTPSTLTAAAPARVPRLT